MKIKNDIYQNNIVTTGYVSGTTYYGDGSNLTGIITNETWTIVKATSDQSVTNSATLSASTYLNLSTSANTNYHIRIRILYNTSDATADFKYRLTHSGTTTRVRRVRTQAVPGSTSATYPTLAPSQATNIVFDTTDQTLVNTVAGDGIIYEDIYLQVGASGGTILFSFAQNTQTAAQSVTVYEGSYLEWMTV